MPCAISLTGGFQDDHGLHNRQFLMPAQVGIVAQHPALHLQVIAVVGFKLQVQEETLAV
jgi:hypothetical protein